MWLTLFNTGFKIIFKRNASFSYEILDVYTYMDEMCTVMKLTTEETWISTDLYM